MNHNINLNNTLFLITLLEQYNIYLPSNLLYDISYNLTNNTYINKHLSLIVDNYYLKSDKFPFSLHSEINTINKHYKKRLNKNIIKSKKILLIIKLSKIGIIGDSKPCQNCANFIYNNYDNLNLYKIMYSTQNNELEELTKQDLLYKEFKISAGFKQSFNN